LDLAELTPEGFDRLLIEPLLASPHAQGVRSMIDIGSGGGSPAIPLALAVEGLSLVMIEVKTRKSVFLREAVRELGLRDARVVTARHESLLANTAFHETHDLLTVRAVRVESRTFSALQMFVRPGGRLFHFRSGAEGQPILPPPLRIVETHPLNPYSQSQLVIIQK
jgi:16S rRNA (guanine(527)-N(7))-methyltransferase RsmG